MALSQQRLPPLLRTLPTRQATSYTVPRSCSFGQLRPPPSSLLSAPLLSAHRRSFHLTPTRYDYYKTLDVSRNASSKEIKAQFYALSKKYHPDLNRDDEGAKKKFQEVSEAWNTLGHDRSRRNYDRQLRTGSGGSTQGRGGAPSDYSYDPSDNTARRARASYAWEYQRRRGDSNRSRAGQARHQHPEGGGRFSEAAADRAAQARARGSVHPGGSPRRNATAFERYEAQQRRRDEFVSSRTSGDQSTTADGSELDQQAQAANPIWRFLQLMAVFSSIYFVAGLFTAKTTGSAASTSSSRKA